MSATNSAKAPELSVVIATFNRPVLLARLLRQLARQTLRFDRFEVIVVDDGSRPPAKPSISVLELPYPLTVVEQANQGAASARHHGTRSARGELLVFVDDDMQVAEDFLAQHLAGHRSSSSPLVILGEIRADPAIGSRPLFERYEARMLRLFAERARHGALVPTGRHLYTGNVSMRRSSYVEAGGFDPAFERSEDVELGIRLEKGGASFRFSERAFVLHGSDHTSLESWMGRAFRYGVYDLRVARKHPDVHNVNPFRFLLEVNPVSRPILTLSMATPAAAKELAAFAIRVAQVVDRLGLEALAIRATTLVYGMEYFRGVRAEQGSLSSTLREAFGFLTRGTPLSRGAESIVELGQEIRADHETIRRYEAKYRQRSIPHDRLSRELAEKIGFQMIVAYRVMRALRASGQVTAAKVVARLIRHLYGADIHWEARIDPGVMIVHGFGIAISHAASVGSGSILNQHVTLGEGIDPLTRKRGAPAVGRNVHIGPGATLIGPITIGDGTKIAPGAWVTESVPPNSLVSAPRAKAEPRRAQVAPAIQQISASPGV